MKVEQFIRRNAEKQIIIKTITYTDGYEPNIIENPIRAERVKERMIEQHWQQKSDAAGKYLYRTWEVFEEKVSGYFARMEESKTENPI